MHSALIFSILQDLRPLGAVRSAYWISFNNKKKNLKYSLTLLLDLDIERNKKVLYALNKSLYSKGRLFCTCIQMSCGLEQFQGIIFILSVSFDYQNQFSRKAISSDYGYYGFVCQTSSEPTTKICQN